MNKIERFNKSAGKASNKSAEIVEKIALKEGDKVLEIGVGGGYYAKLFSVLIGKNGIYYGVDTDDEFLDNLKLINQKSEHKNIKAMKVSETDCPEPFSKVNLIFTRNVYHHLSNRSEYFKKLSDFLEDNGKLVIIDYNESLCLMRLFGHFTKSGIVIKEMQKAGYKLKTEHNLLKGQCFLVFEKAK